MTQGNQLLVERLFAEHAVALRAFLYRRTRCPHRAEELAQETWMRVAQISEPNAIRDAVSYLYTIAINLVRVRAKQDRRMQGSVEVDDPMVESQLADRPSFEGQIDAEQRARRLRQVLGELSPKCRAALVLKYMHDHSYEQIAQQLQISTSMVKKYLGQGLAHCRRRMVRLG
jgi:RNA polymerase sigma-70 factor (ECF subfamily)